MQQTLLGEQWRAGEVIAVIIIFIMVVIIIIIIPQIYLVLDRDFFLVSSAAQLPGQNHGSHETLLTEGLKNIAAEQSDKERSVTGRKPSGPLGTL